MQPAGDTNLKPFWIGLCVLIGAGLMIFGTFNRPRPAAATVGDQPADVGREEVAVTGEMPAPEHAPSPAGDAPLLITINRPAPQPPVAEEPAEDAGDGPAADVGLDIGAGSLSDLMPAGAGADEQPEGIEDLEGESEPVTDVESALAVDVVKRVTWAGVAQIRLEMGDLVGAEAVCEWQQTAGPSLTIESPGQVDTRAVGIPRENVTSWDETTYEFIGHAVTPDGEHVARVVQVKTRAAPDLFVVAAGERNHSRDKQFLDYDGATLATFDASMVQPAGYPPRFLLSSGSKLDYQLMGTGDFEMEYFAEDGRHLYAFDVYQSTDEAVTTLEFYVVSEDGIPAVVRLNVTW